MTPSTSSACRISASRPAAGLTKLFSTLERFAATHRLPPSVHQDLFIALDELVTNILHHGKTAKGRPLITVMFKATRSAVQVSVSDDAQPFNPLASPPPRTDQALRDRPIGGLGILFVTRLMDAVTYRRRAGHNCLMLTKRFTAHATGARGRTGNTRR